MQMASVARGSKAPLVCRACILLYESIVGVYLGKTRAYHSHKVFGDNGNFSISLQFSFTMVW
jgi:hypothetical protein